MKIDSKWIAKLSGVSRSTVSRVINDYPDISPATKEKVWKVIKENGYYPNISAQKLAGKKTNIPENRVQIKIKEKEFQNLSIIPS